MAKAERQGQHEWDRYLEAGVVDKHLNWSDDPIVVAHALGKTKQAVGKCWPMDAAVAYTLASAGPDAKLTSKEMVNQYTRIAAAMMSQTVGYSDYDVPDPRVGSCGHDEVIAYKLQFRQVYKTKGGFITFGSDVMEGNSIIKGKILKKIPKELAPLLSFRVREKTMNQFTNWSSNRYHGDGNPNRGVVNVLSLLRTPKFRPLMKYIEKELGTTKWSMQCKNTPFNATFTRGVCAWEGKVDEKGMSVKCAHHDEPKYQGWVLLKQLDAADEIVDNRFERMWIRGTGATVHSGWNRNQMRNKFGSHILRTLDPKRVVLWSRVSRGLSNTIPDRMVIKEINAACRRMTARNFNVVRKDGLRNTATYTWKEWNWLANLKSWIAQTRQKNRKEHDLVNGWKWTKFNSRMSYGYEIANFKWIPGMVNENYNEDQHKSVTQKGDQTITSYATPPAVKMPMKVYKLKMSTGYYGSTTVNWVWRTKAEIKQFVDFLPMMAKRTGAVGIQGNREWDAENGSESLPLEKPFNIVSDDLASRLVLPMDADPEDLPSPTELFQALHWGNPQEFDAAKKLLADESKGYWNRPKIVNEPKENGDEDGGATPVAN